MVEIIAWGSGPNERWKTDLKVNVETTIGRGVERPLITWDDRISRAHAKVVLRHDRRVEVNRIPGSKNPIFFRGQKRDSFVVVPGEHFVIGSTSFTVATRTVVGKGSSTPIAVTEHAFAPGELKKKVFRDAGSRIEMLCQLPELISGSSSESELLVRVASVILQATSAATQVAVVRIDGKEIHVMHNAFRLATDRESRPSERLVREAVRRGDNIIHLWTDQDAIKKDSENQFTVSDNVDWAFSVPVLSEACPNWVIYVSGRFGLGAARLQETAFAKAQSDLEDDVKFTELVATTLGNLQQMRVLQNQQAGLSRFFAPVVMQALSGRDAFEVLRPRQTDISVLFCDLRGFSRKSEEESGELMRLLERVSEALGIMTSNILRFDGVIGDFHGDAAMGFWGWPLSQADSPQRACQTALAIWTDFQTQASVGKGALGGFRCGIGVASGKGVAGRIGTSDQVKVTAFGPVVNLASRLEGMTKLFSTEILVDEPTADFVRGNLSSDIARVRRLAKVRPAGMQSALVVHQLLPPADTPGTLADKHISAYENALQSLFDRRWDEAFELLHEVPASDRAKDFLTVFIASHGRVAPEQWDGVIPLATK